MYSSNIKRPVSELAGPIAHDNPCGDNLEYDDDYLLLERLSIGREERQHGQALIHAEPPRWDEIERSAWGLAQRTKDLRLASLIAQAWLALDGLQGLSRGLELTVSWLERYWDELHPRLDAFGEFDPVPRLNAIAALAAPEGMARLLRNTPLITGRDNVLPLKDVAGILSGAASATQRPDKTTIIESLCNARSGEPGDIGEVPRILELLARIKAIFVEKLDAHSAPDFGAIEAPLRIIGGAVPALAANEPEGPGLGLGEPEPPLAAPADLKLRSRRDVVFALELASAYLERHEPSHPAPLLIRRALRLMDMNFYDIVRELAPASLAQVEAVTGIASLAPTDPPPAH